MKMKSNRKHTHTASIKPSRRRRLLMNQAVAVQVIKAGRKLLTDVSIVSSGSLYILVGLMSSFCFEVNPTTPKYNTIILIGVLLVAKSSDYNFVRVPLLLIFFICLSIGIDLIFLPDLFHDQHRIAFVLAMMAILTKLFAIYKMLSINDHARKYLHRFHAIFFVLVVSTIT
jgi:hypothetical protein